MHLRPLYHSLDIRNIEKTYSALPLMERAGEAAASYAETLVLEGGRDILVLAGPGNNGGDAFVLARRLKARFFKVHTVFFGDPTQLSDDAKKAYDAFLREGLHVLHEMPSGCAWGLVVDGLFGIGLNRPVSSAYRALMDRVNEISSQAKIPVLALDCPSGLNVDTGAFMGAAIRATHTLTFIGEKPGLFMNEGREYAGVVTLGGLGLDLSTHPRPRGAILSPRHFWADLPRRHHNSHKGSHGSVGVMGGASGMIGAALLAGRAALKCGSGRVYVSLLDEVSNFVDPLSPELMFRSLRDFFDQPLTAIACGMGLGRSARALMQVEAAIQSPWPLVLDADALNLLATSPHVEEALGSRKAPTILTPHPAEAARLLQSSTETVQNDRIQAACALASRFKAYVALKGAGTVIANDQGDYRVNITGNPALASAGTGDVLSGVIAALLAQGMPAEAAVAAGVYLHGEAADHWRDSGEGMMGCTASELIPLIRTCLNRWVALAEPQSGASASSRLQVRL